MDEIGPVRGLSTLLAVALAAGLLVSYSHHISRDRIAENERAFLLRRLGEVAGAALYDNDLAASRFQVQDEALLGSGGPVDVHLGTQAGIGNVVLISATAPDGYNGPIKLLVGIDRRGTITGVRVIDHRETPGLGDAIELERTDWILGFAGRTLTDPPLAGWQVRADGGQFDQLTGATITPRAVVHAVRNVLIYFSEHRDELLQTPAEEADESDD